MTFVAKVPEITLWFWITKILCTSIGEVGADALTMSYFGETTEGVTGFWHDYGYLVGAGVFLVLPVGSFLASFAIPAWQRHALRAEVAQGLELTERARALVAEYIGARGALPENNRVLGLPKPEAIHARYVTSVRVAGGKVVVTYGNEANTVIRGGHVVISPMGSAARLHWRCSSTDIDVSYLPRQCQP